MDISGQKIAFLPDGRPAPAVMTPEETAQFLRLDGPNPDRTLKYWRDEDLLRGVILARKVHYPLDEVLKFLAQKAAKKQE